MIGPILVPAMRRAKRDPIATLLAKTTACGIRFRISGATLQVAGAGHLHPADQALLRTHIEDIRLRLKPPAPEADLLEKLDIEVEVITDADRAAAVLDKLHGRGALGFDLETASLNGNGSAAPWVRITRDGRRAVHQPHPADKAGLDPLTAAPRLVQLYDPAAAMIFVIDLKYVPITVLEAIADLPLIIHNSAFEHAMLLAQGVRLRRTFCSLQMARLTYGAERGGLRLADIAADVLDLELPKDEQTSDWGATRLSQAQIEYAAVDAVAAHRVGNKLWAGLDAGARRAFRLGNATVPAVAAMRLAGIPFRTEIHRATIARWEQSYADARAAFVALTGEEPPAQGKARSSWLEARLPEDMRSWWPRTDTGLLRTRSADLDRLAAVAEIRPLLEVLAMDKRLRAFGPSLLARVSPDGRLRMDLKAAATKSGRCSCSDANTQQLPQDVRKAVEAEDGSVLVIADYSQIEFRCAAELSGDEALRQIFRNGHDLHVLNAEDFIGASLDTLPEDEREITRNKAKRIGFGVLYGSGARGLVTSAWSMYRIEMAEGEAQLWKDRFYARYPQLRAWQHQTAEAAATTGVLRSVAGRPLRAEWEPIQPLKWTLCCNYPVQSSAADVMLLAMARVHSALEGLDARLLLQVHDELVVECAVDIAAQVEDLVRRYMTAAYRELFPDAPLLGVVDVATRRCWAKPPNAGRAT